MNATTLQAPKASAVQAINAVNEAVHAEREFRTRYTGFPRWGTHSPKLNRIVAGRNAMEREVINMLDFDARVVSYADDLPPLEAMVYGRQSSFTASFLVETKFQQIFFDCIPQSIHMQQTLHEHEAIFTAWNEQYHNSFDYQPITSQNMPNRCLANNLAKLCHHANRLDSWQRSRYTQLILGELQKWSPQHISNFVASMPDEGTLVSESDILTLLYHGEFDADIDETPLAFNTKLWQRGEHPVELLPMPRITAEHVEGKKGGEIWLPNVLSSAPVSGGTVLNMK